MSDERGKRAEVPELAYVVGFGEPFCACGRRWSDCDGSRRACHRAAEVREPLERSGCTCPDACTFHGTGAWPR